jgi:hypothetical protein
LLAFKVGRSWRIRRAELERLTAIDRIGQHMTQPTE